MVSEKIFFCGTVGEDNVLILVLVEDGLGDTFKITTAVAAECLNPCFSGGWSRSNNSQSRTPINKCLNPCFSGGWSRRRTCFCSSFILPLVLILVLVEDGLGVDKNNKR